MDYGWGSVHYKDEYGNPCSKENAERYGSTEMNIRKRAGNATRNRYVEHLSNMMAEGFLTEEEFDERQSQALATQYEAELVLLVADLPSLPPEPRPAPVMVRRNCGFDKHQFSALRWVLTSLSCILMIFAPSVLASVFHGFDHIGPGGHGVLPVLMIMAGVVGTLIFGIGFAPGEMKEKLLWAGSGRHCARTGGRSASGPQVPKKGRPSGITLTSGARSAARTWNGKCSAAMSGSKNKESQMQLPGTSFSKANVFLALVTTTAVIGGAAACSSASSGGSPVSQQPPPPIPQVHNPSRIELGTDWQTDDLFSFCWNGARVFVLSESKIYNDSVSSVPGDAKNGC